MDLKEEKDSSVGSEPSIAYCLRSALDGCRSLFLSSMRSSHLSSQYSGKQETPLGLMEETPQKHLSSPGKHLENTPGFNGNIFITLLEKQLWLCTETCICYFRPRECL